MESLTPYFLEDRVHLDADILEDFFGLYEPDE